MPTMPARKTLFAKWTAACLATACLAPAFAAQAKNATYHYVGQPYTTITGGTCLTTSMNVTFKVILSAKLGPNFSGQVTPIAWFAADGVRRLSSKSASVGSVFLFTTDANGDITDWEVEAESATKKGAEILIGTVNFPGETGDLSLVPCGKTNSGAQSTTPGSW